MIKSNLLFAFVCLVFSAAHAQTAQIDSIRQRYLSSSTDSIAFEEFYNLSSLALNSADSIQQLAYLDTLQTIADRIDAPLFKGRVLFFQSRIFRKQGQVLEQRAALEKAKQLFSIAPYNDRLCDTEYALAGTYLPEGDYESAFLGYERALQLYRELGYEVQIANTLNALGVVQRRANNFDSAIEYLSEAATASKALGDSGGEATALLNQAVIHKTRKEYELAIPLYERGLELAAGPPENGGLAAYIHNNLSALYFDQGKFELSLAEGEKAYTFFAKHGQHRELVTVNLGMASNLMGLKRYNEAIPRFREVLENSKSELLIRQDTHEGLAKCFAATSQLDSALYHMDRAKQLQKQLADESRIQALAEAEGRYQNKEKQAQIDLLAAEDERKALAISRRNWTLDIGHWRYRTATCPGAATLCKSTTQSDFRAKRSH